MIKFSIVIPHYNLVESLANLLDSIPDKEDVQTIVVDDGSPQEAVERIKKLEKKYSNMHFIYSASNQGAGASRNIGLNYADGDFVIFADTDDYFTSNAYDIWVDLIKSNSDIIYSRVNCLQYENNLPSDWLKKRNDNIERLKNNENQLNRWLRFCYTEPWGKIFRKRFLEENNIRFEESLVANDYRFSVVSGLKANSIKYIDSIFYNYMIRSGSLSNKQNYNKSKILSRLKVYFNIQNLFKKNKIYIRPFDRYVNSLDREILNDNDIEKYLKSIGYKDFSKFKGFVISSVYRTLTLLFEKLKIPYCGF